LSTEENSLQKEKMHFAFRLMFQKSITQSKRDNSIKKIWTVFVMWIYGNSILFLLKKEKSKSRNECERKKKII